MTVFKILLVFTFSECFTYQLSYKEYLITVFKFCPFLCYQLISENFGENHMILLQTVAKWLCIKLFASFSGPLCTDIIQLKWETLQISRHLTVHCLNVVCCMQLIHVTCGVSLSHSTSYHYLSSKLVALEGSEYQTRALCRLMHQNVNLMYQYVRKQVLIRFVSLPRSLWCLLHVCAVVQGLIR